MDVHIIPGHVPWTLTTLASQTHTVLNMLSIPIPFRTCIPMAPHYRLSSFYCLLKILHVNVDVLREQSK